MDQIIKEVAQLLNMDEKLVRTVITSFFRDFHKTVTRIRYRDLENLKDVRTNAVIPGLGRFVVTNKEGRKINKKKDNDSTSK